MEVTLRCSEHRWGPSQCSTVDRLTLRNAEEVVRPAAKFWQGGGKKATGNWKWRVGFNKKCAKGQSDTLAVLKADWPWPFIARKNWTDYSSLISVWTQVSSVLMSTRIYHFQLTSAYDTIKKHFMDSWKSCSMVFVNHEWIVDSKLKKSKKKTDMAMT